MKDYLAAERYAKALSAVIEDSARLDGVLEDLRGIADLLLASHDLSSCLGNPAIDVTLREKVLDDVLARTDAAGCVKRLMHELLERGRIGVLPSIVELFEDVVDVRLGRTTAVVTTAAPLDDAQTERLRAGLSRFSGKQVRLKFKTDPNIIGGVKARIGGQVIDGSLRTRLQHIKNALIAEEL